MSNSSQDTAPNQSESTGQAAARGVMWTGGAQAIRQVIQVVTAVTLARLLVPDDFGLLGMAMVFVAFTQLLANFGIGAAIIHAKDLDQTQLSSAFLCNLAIGLGLVALVAATSPLIGEFYGEPRAAPVVAEASLLLLIGALMTVPQALLFKRMQFEAPAKAGVMGGLIGAAAAIAMAWQGLGVWSLVAQPIVGSTITMALVWRASRWRPGLRFSWDAVKGLIGFSAGVLGSNLLTEVNRKADDVLIGRYLGSVPLGFYTLAYQIMLYPLNQVASVIVRVLFPALSTLQDDPQGFRRGYIKATSTISMVTFPAMLGLIVVAPDFVRVVFGEQWLPMTTTLQILAIVGMVQSVTTTLGAVYMGSGRTRLMFLVTLVNTPILLTGFIIGLSWGIEGVATAFALVVILPMHLRLYIAFRSTAIRIHDFHRAALPPLVAALAMAGSTQPGDTGAQALAEAVDARTRILRASLRERRTASAR